MKTSKHSPNPEHIAKEPSLLAIKAEISSLWAALYGGVTLKIEVSHLRQIGRVYEWGVLERTHESDGVDTVQRKKKAPDTLVLQGKPEGGPRAVLWKDVGLDESGGIIFTEFEISIQALLFLENERLFAKIHGSYLSLNASDEIMEFVRQRQQTTPVEIGDDFSSWLEAFDHGLCTASSAKNIPESLSNSSFSFQTAQESDWLLRAACDGRGLTGYRKSPERNALIYEEIGASHRVELTQDAPGCNGELLEMDALEWLATQQSADFGFTFFYICRLIAPAAPLPVNRAAIGWIDLDDVAEKIGYDVDGCTAEQREELRAKIWQFLLFGSRALVIGQRKNYRDRATGETIETRIETPPWRILDKERPIQTAMFGETPRRVQLLISKEWEPLLTAPALAQYLPFAEIVGALPANQTAGAWARVLGMALANFWRRLPHEATGATSSIRPTRRELLTRYTPKANKDRTNTPLVILASKNPKLAVNHWRNALGMLVETGFLAAEGEALRSVAEMLEPLPKYKWQEAWLDECVDLRPGVVEMSALRERASAKPVSKPRILGPAKPRATRKKKTTE